MPAMADLDYTKYKYGEETIQDYIARMPAKCPVCGDNPVKDACPCGCHEAVSRMLKLADEGDDVGFHRGGPHPGDPDDVSLSRG